MSQAWGIFLIALLKSEKLMSEELQIVGSLCGDLSQVPQELMILQHERFLCVQHKSSFSVEITTGMTLSENA